MPQEELPEEYSQHWHMHVKMIDQGSSELNIIIGVRNHDFDAAIKAIYDIFVNTRI